MEVVPINLGMVSTTCYSFTSTGYDYYIEATYDNVMITTWKRFSNIHSIGDEATGKDLVQHILMSGGATDILSPLP